MAFGQQEHQYTQFMYNKLLLNPGYAGARGIPFLTGIYRNQWAGFDGAPKSGLISFNSPFLTQRVGIGVTLSARQIGLDKDVYGSLAYSYDIINDEAINVRVGLMGSMKSFSVDFSKAQPTNPGDVSIGSKKDPGFYANVGAGVYAGFSEKYYIGFSIPQLYANDLGINQTPGTNTAVEVRHIYGMAGASFPLSEDISIMPAILTKYVKNAPFDADLNVNLDIKKKVTAGLSYRLGGEGSGESVDLLCFFQATPQLGIGAAYDFTLTQIKDYSSGSFEVMVQYDLKSKTNNMSNPRFFF